MTTLKTSVAVILVAATIAGCIAVPQVPDPGRKLPAPTAEVQATAEEKGLDKWPCLSYTLGCGKIPTRPPLIQKLVGQLNGDIVRGKDIALKRICIACHHFDGGEQPGTVAPDLSHYGTSGRNDQDTYSLVYDMRSRNPDTVMPPFGTNEILNDQEIRDVIAFLQSLK